jgi:nicotinamidase-related amidase
MKGITVTSQQIPAFIATWFDTLTDQPLDDAVSDPETTAVFSADMINGFLRFGALASERVNQLTDPVVSLFHRAWSAGVTEFVLLQDTHSPETPEFEAYPPHCIAGTDESATISEISGLPFAERFTVIEKNSLHPAIDTEFDDWLRDHDALRTAIVVGDCTDLCTYQLAMHLRMRANAHNIAGFEVIVPADCVSTFDIPALPDTPAGKAHPAEFFHQVFLYHMASNGIRIVRSLT